MLVQLIKRLVLAFNRTIVELKLATVALFVTEINPFNRTIVELKRFPPTSPLTTPPRGIETFFLTRFWGCDILV